MEGTNAELQQCSSVDRFSLFKATTVQHVGGRNTHVVFRYHEKLKLLRPGSRTFESA
jgi:hypothetical protein